MALSEKLQYLITVNADGAVRSFQNVGKAADKELGKAESRMDALGAKFTKFGVGALATAGVAAAGLWKLGEGASDLAETVSKSNVVFGDAAATIDEFGTSAAKAIGQSKVAAMDAAATFGTFGKSAGKTGEDLAKFSIDMVKLSSDMASFSNTTPEEAVMAIGAALRGESEPIRKYGVLLNDATLKNRAMELGIFDGVGALNAQQKVLAAQAEILAQTGDAQGDFARTSDGLANQQRIFAAELQNTKDTIGAAVLPAMQTLVGVAGDVFGAFNALPAGVQQATGSVAAFGVAALGITGVTSTVIGQLIKMRDTFSTVDKATGVRTFTTLSKSLAGVGLAIGVASVAYQIYSDRKQEAEERTNDLADALLGEASAQNEALAELASNDKQVKRFLESQKSLSLATEDLTEFIREGTGAAGDIAEAWATAEESADGTFPTLDAFAEQLGLGTDATYEQIAALRDFVLQLLELRSGELDRAETQALVNDVTGLGAEGTRDYADAISETIPFVDKINEAFGESQTQIDDMDEALRDLQGRLDDRAAWRNMKESLDELQETIADNESTWMDLGAATDEAVQKTAAYIMAADHIPTEKKTELITMLDQGALNMVLLIMDDLEKGVKVPVTFTSTGMGSGQAGGMPPYPGGRDGNPRTPYPMAEGGVVMPRPGGTPAILGEAGRPEAVIPLDRAGNMLNGSGGITVNIYPRALPTDRELIDLVNSVRRRNGNVI